MQMDHEKSECRGPAECEREAKRGLIKRKRKKFERGRKRERERG